MRNSRQILELRMDYSFWFDTLNFGSPLYISRVSGYHFKNVVFILSEGLFSLTNRVDTDEMQHYAAFHICLHCLKKYLFISFPNTKC